MTADATATQSDAQREQELKAVVRYWWSVHTRWQKNDAQPTPPPEWLEAVRAIPEAFSVGTLPGSLRTAAYSALMKLPEALLKWKPEETPYPNESVRIALYEIHAAVEAQDVAPPHQWVVESAWDLHKQGLTLPQMARLLFGDPAKTGWVQQELACPGIITKAPGYKPPAQIAFEEEAKNLQLRANRNLAAVQARLKINEDLGEMRDLPAIAPESVEELLRQKVSPAQIAKMKQISVEEVHAAAARLMRVEGLGAPKNPISDHGSYPLPQAFETPEQRVGRLQRELAAAMDAAAKAIAPPLAPVPPELRPVDPLADEITAEQLTVGPGGMLEFAAQNADDGRIPPVNVDQLHATPREAPSEAAPRIPGAKLGKFNPDMPPTPYESISAEAAREIQNADDPGLSQQAAQSESERDVVMRLISQGRTDDEIKGETGMHGNAVKAIRKLYGKATSVQ